MQEYGNRDKEQRTTSPAAVRQKKCSSRACALAGPNYDSLIALQRMIAAGTKQPLQRVSMPEPDEEELTQRKANKTGIPDTVKQRVEAALNSDFSDVRIHANSAKAPAVGAVAYT